MAKIVQLSVKDSSGTDEPQRLTPQLRERLRAAFKELLGADTLLYVGADAQGVVLTVPLEEDVHGVRYIVGTRVPLSALLEDYRSGADADELALSYPTVRLDDIHALLSYYLKHREMLEGYLAAQAERAQVQRAQALERFPQADLRQRLRARAG